MPASADDDKDIRHGRGDNDKGIHAEIAALQVQMASLQSTVSGLQGQVSALQTNNAVQQNQINKLQTNNAKLQNQVTSLQASNATLQNQLTAARNVLALAPFVSADLNQEIGVVGPHIKFKGANIHIESGSGATDDRGNTTGLGNLIIGYDEDPVIFLPPGTTGGDIPLRPGDRGGSHNLGIGRANKFARAAFGGILAGELNTISNEAASVTGGFQNTASGDQASVTGGAVNTASGPRASVSGRLVNFAIGNSDSISGGQSNVASGDAASVSGGNGNNATAFAVTVCGGFGNTAGGIGTVVIGGLNVTDNNNNSIAPQPPFKSQ